MEPPMKAKTTPDERLRIDALRYRALRWGAIFPTGLDNEADRLRQQLADEGIILDTRESEELHPRLYSESAPPVVIQKKKRAWSKQRREKHARMMEKRKATKLFGKERADEVSESRVQPRS
jgi:hypothetical protein